MELAKGGATAVLTCSVGSHVRSKTYGHPRKHESTRHKQTATKREHFRDLQKTRQMQAAATFIHVSKPGRQEDIPSIPGTEFMIMSHLSYVTPNVWTSKQTKTTYQLIRVSMCIFFFILFSVCKFVAMIV